MNLIEECKAYRTLEALSSAQPEAWRRHSRNVEQLAADLAAAAGCSTAQADRIRIGSLLHDIGKQFVPEHILNKDGLLTAPELGRVQMHPWMGYVYLGHFVSDSTLLNTVLYHHERWNGSGYPNRLEGDGIPLGARICAIADVWDALISERCYRSAWTMTQALDLICAGAGSLFDPQLVLLFVQLIRDRYVRDRPEIGVARTPLPAAVPAGRGGWNSRPRRAA